MFLKMCNSLSFGQRVVTIDPKLAHLPQMPVSLRALRMVLVSGICLVEVALIVFKIGLSMAWHLVEEIGTRLVEVAMIIFKIGLSTAWHLVEEIGICLVEVVKLVFKIGLSMEQRTV